MDKFFTTEEKYQLMRNKILEIKKQYIPIRKRKNNENTYKQRLETKHFCCFCGSDIDKYAEKTHDKTKKHIKNVELMTQILNDQV